MRISGSKEYFIYFKYKNQFENIEKILLLIQDCYQKSRRVGSEG